MSNKHFCFIILFIFIFNIKYYYIIIKRCETHVSYSLGMCVATMRSICEQQWITIAVLTAAFLYLSHFQNRHRYYPRPRPHSPPFSVLVILLLTLATGISLPTPLITASFLPTVKPSFTMSLDAAPMAASSSISSVPFLFFSYSYFSFFISTIIKLQYIYLIRSSINILYYVRCVVEHKYI